MILRPGANDNTGFIRRCFMDKMGGFFGDQFYAPDLLMGFTAETQRTRRIYYYKRFFCDLCVLPSGLSLRVEDCERYCFSHHHYSE
jgi:hypothetical protein